MPNNAQRAGMQAADGAVVTRQHFNGGGDELASEPYNSTGRERPVDIVRADKVYYLHCWADATVTVAGVGGAPTVRENGFTDIVERLRTRLLSETLHEHGGRDFLELNRRLTATVLEYDDGGFDPTSAGDYDLHFEFLVPFALPFMAREVDFHIREALSEDEVRQALIKWATDVENAGTDDEGTGVLVSGGTQTLTWAAEPQFNAVAETAPPRSEGGGPLPIAITKLETYESETFTSATTGLTIPFTPDAPVLMLLFQGLDDGDPADLIERMTIGDNPNLFDLPVEFYRMLERRMFDAIETTVDHSVAIRLADGGLWTNRWRPAIDSRKQRIKVTTSAPSGNGRIRVIAVTGVRKNIGSDVRADLRPTVKPTG